MINSIYFKYIFLSLGSILHKKLPGKWFWINKVSPNSMTLTFVNLNILNALLMLNENTQFCAWEPAAYHTDMAGRRRWLMSAPLAQF